MTQKNAKSNAKSEIQRNLQRVYEEAFEEDLPPQFMEMIERLKSQKAKSDDEKS